MAESLFDEILAIVSEKSSQVDPIGSSVKVDFGGKCIHMDGTGSSNQLATEDKQADCTIKVKEADFHAILTGELNPLTAIMKQQVKFEGNPAVALALTSLF